MPAHKLSKSVSEVNQAIDGERLILFISASKSPIKLQKPNSKSEPSVQQSRFRAQRDSNSNWRCCSN